MSDILNYKTDNSYKMREKLLSLGYPCLSFFTQGKFIRVGHCQWANAKKHWVEKYSCATDDHLRSDLIGLQYIDNETFIHKLLNN